MPEYLDVDNKKNEYVLKEDVKLALIEAGQRSTRYKVGDFWELNATEICDAVDAIPPAAVEVVKNGNWVGIDDDPCETFECDVCGFVLDDWIQGALYRYCPNCGARMVGD